MHIAGRTGRERGSPLDSRELERLLATCPQSVKNRMERCHYAQGEDIIRAGETARWVYLLAKGRIRVFYYTGGGDLVINYLGHKNRTIFGESEVLQELPTIFYNVQAETDCDTLRLSKDDFWRWLERDHAFCIYLIRWQNRRSSDASRFGVMAALLPLRVRTAVLIQENLAPDGRVRIDKTTLAGLLATSMRSTNRIVKTLREEGVLAVDGENLRVLDPAVLQAIVDIRADFEPDQDYTVGPDPDGLDD